jgi:hypothetical protein
MPPRSWNESPRRFAYLCPAVHEVAEHCQIGLEVVESVGIQIQVVAEKLDSTKVLSSIFVSPSRPLSRIACEKSGELPPSKLSCCFANIWSVV